MRNNDDSLLQRALRFLATSSGEAENVARDPEEVESLVDKSSRKMHKVKDSKHNFKSFFPQLLTFQRMLKAYSRREYPHLPWKSLLSIIGAILYFLNPLDLIPDFIPGIGLIDDITVLAWAYKSLGTDVSRFEEWEYENRTA